MHDYPDVGNRVRRRGRTDGQTDAGVTVTPAAEDL